VTHRQALAARRVAELPGSRETRLTRYRDVAAASLLALHPQESGPWVAELLGELAGPGEELARLRLTLRAYLEAGENASNAALRLYVHRNTVKYRVARALDLLPVPFEQNRLSIALALAYHDRAEPRTAPQPGRG
jgi:DNA-binding PucR family transcriptional regulator